MATPIAQQARSAPSKPLIVILAVQEQSDLLVQLKNLLEPAGVELWDRPQAGESITKVPEERIAAAKVVVVLVSAALLSAKGPEKNWLAAALKRSQGGGLRVIPILARQCLWRYGDLRDIQMLPVDGSQLEPVTEERFLVLAPIADAILAAAFAGTDSKPAIGEEPLLATLGNLEKIVGPGGFFDPEALQRLLRRGQRQLCHIEEADGAPLGTGFLVGPDVVLTNHHVIAEFLKPKPDAIALRVRFDYTAKDKNDQPNGVTYHVIEPFPRAARPLSPVDFSETTDLPSLDELDFALLRLDGAPGRDDFAGEERGWVRLASECATPRKDEFVLVFQHPGGDPIKVTIDQIVFVNDNKTRARYRANTRGGSSGSPCFSLRQKLVAVHHGGDEKLNQGIVATALQSYFKTHNLPG